MKKIYLGLIIIFSFAFAFILNNVEAAEPVKLVYEGQKIDQLYYFEKVDITRFRYEDVESTCYRDVLDHYENVCSSYTDYEQSCHSNPSETVCSDSPSRTVCSTSPGREVCGTNPRTGEQHCNSVGGNESCVEVGGGSSCHEVGGGQSCTSVPVSRTRCEDEAIYRSEAYSCIKTIAIPYVVKVTVENKINFEFIGDSKERIEFDFAVENEVVGTLKVTENFSNAIVAVIVKKESKVDLGENFKLEINYLVQILDLSKLPVSLNKLKMTGFHLERRTDSLSFQVSGKLDLTEILSFSINDASSEIDFSKLKTDGRLKNNVVVKVLPSGITSVWIGLKGLGVVKKLGWLKRYDLNLKLKKNILRSKNAVILSGKLDLKQYQVTASAENLKDKKD